MYFKSYKSVVLLFACNDQSDKDIYFRWFATYRIKNHVIGKQILQPNNS